MPYSSQQGATKIFLKFSIQCIQVHEMQVHWQYIRSIILQHIQFKTASTLCMFFFVLFATSLYNQ